MRDHLTQVEEIARGFAEIIGAGNPAGIAGLLHDIGKYSDEFQQRLEGKSISVNHSFAGAKEAYQRYGRAFGKLLAYIIAGHHAGLPDGADLLKSTADIKNYSEFQAEIRPPDTALKLPDLSPASNSNEDIGFCIAFLVRFLYSCLVDADFLDTEKFMEEDHFNLRGGYTPPEKLLDSFNRYRSGRFSGVPSTPLNTERQKVMNACVSAARRAPGLFTLTVPTGGGKTLSSLAFALNHAASNNMERIIYAIPYTSIIEQTAEQFRSALGNSNVLEHHSNFTPPNDEKASTRQRLLSENWDAPVIVTTNVQLFETLFSNRPSRCRKLHNIANSVIVLDEAQMLPKNFLLPCLAGLRELILNYKCSVVLCTATQPAISEYLKLAPYEIIPDPKELYRKLRRTHEKLIGLKSENELADDLKACDQVLCIVNTRAQAANLTRLLGHINGVFHLSTMMYPRHRAAVLEKIRQELIAGKPCKVISTNLVECGVDLDFPVVYREMAGLDSLAQAAGRCNREGTQQSGPVYIFEFSKTLRGTLNRAASSARSTLRRFDDLLGPDAITDYFRQFYSMGSADGLDEYGIMKDMALGARQQQFPFKKIADEFKLIDNGNMTPVIIPCKKSTELIEKLDYMESPGKLIRLLQPYTVNIYQNQLNALDRAGLLDHRGQGIFHVLNNSGWYSSVTGLLGPDDAPEYGLLMY